MMRNVKKVFVAVTIVLAGLILIGCTANDEQSSDNGGTALTGIKWALSGVTQDGAVSSTPIDEDIYIQFDGEAAQGNSGCNNFSGSYQIDGDALTMSGMVGTMRACADGERNQRESEFLTALGETTSFRIETDRLILINAAGEDQLSFTATGSAQ